MRLAQGLFHHLVIFTLLLLSLYAKAQEAKPIDDARLSTYVDSLFQRYHNDSTPGAAVSVIYDGKVQYKQAYGSANLEYDVLNTTSTIFHVASLAKQFTAFSILLLQEEGKLSLDDDIRKYIPEVPDFGHTITLRHLATHTSGLRDQWNLLLIAGVRPDDVITNEHVLALIAEQKELNFPPGEEYLYCNTGYSLLAEVVARVSGQRFAEFTHDRIFSPLNMVNTSFHDDHEKIIKHRAYSYYSRDGVDYSKRVLSYANVGPTNLLTTVEDLSLWIMNFENAQVGSPEIFEQMTTEAKLNNGKTFGGGLGLFMNDQIGISEIEHGGADAGFRVQLSMFPSQGLGVIVLSNNARCDTRSLASEVADFYLKEIQEEGKDVASKDTQRKYIKLRPEAMESFVGHYWTKEHAYTRKIYLKNDTLMHFRGENNESPLAAIGKNEFQVMNVPVNALLRFERDGDEITLIETVDGGMPKILERYAPVQYATEDWLKYEGEYYSEELKTVYVIEWDENKLTAHHMRMGSIELTMIKHNFFKADRGFFGSVEFLRDDAENVTGFRLSDGRVRDLLFEKQQSNGKNDTKVSID